MEVHIVVKGDTLWKIARQYGIPFEELKRANAHLAKSEYIVPGMKIFLPKKVHGGKQDHVKHPDKGKLPVKPSEPPAAPHTKPVPPKPVPKPPVTKPLPKPPIPIPVPPVRPPQSPPPVPAPPIPRPFPPPVPAPPIPRPVPPPVPAPPLPTPVPPPVPAPPLPTPVPPPLPAPPMQSHPMPPFVHYCHPMIGLPCGCLPIFDADCHPFMHSGQIQAMPMPMPMPPASEQPGPFPFPTPSLPSTPPPMIEDDCEESPIFSGQGPAMNPQHLPMIDGWQLIESPEHIFEESPNMGLETDAWCPPEQGYIPQVISPMSQQHFPMMPISNFQQPCSCGGYHHHHHQHPHHMMMPMYYQQLCNCHPSMHPTPYQMMPTYQGPNWYGTY